jgi:hypothetical protein
VVIAAVAGFMLGWLWYGVLFSRQWLNAVGKAEAEIKGGDPTPAPFIVAFVSLLVMAWILAGLIGHLGVGQTSLRHGVVSGAFCWLGFVITTMVVSHAFEGARMSLTLINGGHWLAVLLLQGAIIGGMGV